MAKIVLLLVVSLYIGLQGALAVNNTLLGIPFLFPYYLRDNCSQLYPADDANKYHFVYTSQIEDQGSLVEFFTVHMFDKTTDGICKRHPQISTHFLHKGYSLYGLFQSDDEFCKNRFSLCYQCKNEVMAMITYFYSNPSVSMIAHLFGSYFNHSLAIYPMDVFEDTENDTYTYRVLFGAARPSIMDGIVLHVMYYDTNITLQTTVDIGVQRNGQKEYLFYRAGEIMEFTDVCHNTIFWIEPHTDSSNAWKLQQAIIESTKPMKVFTNQAYVNKSKEFSYQTQLVHEMPPLERWGQHFVIDIHQAKMLPGSVRNSMRNSLMCKLSMISSEPNNATIVNVTYHDWNTSQTTVEQFILYEHSVSIYKHHSLIHFVTHITVQSNSPILIVYNVYNDVSEKISGAIFYSVIVQPTSWFTNIQTVTLSSSNSSDSVNYVSVVVPTQQYKPHDLMLSMAQSFNESISLREYEGFSEENIVTGADFTLLRFSVTEEHLQQMDNNSLLIWHKNRSVGIGATVYAYSPQRHYAYSNGYVLEPLEAETQQSPGPSSSVDSKVIVIIVLASMLITVSLLLIVVCYCKRKGTNSTYHHVRDDEQPVISEEPGTDFEYDLFILFSDEDGSLVQSCIYDALRKEGYKVLWKYDSSHGLFQPGADIVTDLAKAIQISRKILVVCTKNFQAFERDVSFFTDVQKSEKKRRLVPFVVEQEYQKSNQFKEYNQIRVEQRQDMFKSTVARDVLQKLTNSLGHPLNASTMENLL